MEDEKYYVIKKKAVPEVLLKVLEVQKLLDTRQAVSVMEAAENVGISRSSPPLSKSRVITSLSSVSYLSDIPFADEMLPGIPNTVGKITAIATATPINTFLIFASHFRIFLSFRAIPPICLL